MVLPNPYKIDGFHERISNELVVYVQLFDFYQNNEDNGYIYFLRAVFMNSKIFNDDR